MIAAMKRSFATAFLAALLVASPMASGQRTRPVQLPTVNVVGKVVGPPIWELRVGEHRIFYDVNVEERTVYVRAVRRKAPHKTTKEIL